MKSVIFERFTIPGEMKILRSEILYIKTIDSTNACLLGEEFTENGTILLADYQTAGRGRFSRTWKSPAAESLLFSVLLTNFMSNKKIYIYTFLAAVAAFSALKKHISEDHHLSLKWPNDVLLDGYKLCGILVQGRMSGAVQARLVIGIGINVNQPREYFSGDLSNGTSLFAATGQRYNRELILSTVLKQLDRQLILLQDNGESLILSQWRMACDSIGKMIAVDDGQKIYGGVFKDISRDGSLILDTGSKELFFRAGDVTILKGK